MSPAGLRPLGRIHHLRAELEALLELLLEGPSAAAAGWTPPVDLVELDDAVLVQLELPGVAASDLQLELVDLRLEVRGTKSRLGSEPPGGRFFLMERFIGSFAATVDLPCPVLAGRGEARLEHGVLTVTLPKLKDRRHRRHAIPVAEE